jgi:AcrR family transcriptional regulator
MMRKNKKRGDRDTRQRLLEIAGRVFAEKGLAGATGKEICGRAKANVAAINYHFRSLDGLYRAVLREAMKRMPSLDEVRAALGSAKDSRAMLTAAIDLMVRAITNPVSNSWPMQVVGRETLNPSPAFVILKDRKIRPRMLLLKGVLAEIMQLPPSHPAVERSCVSVMAPCWVLLLGHRWQLKRAFPKFGYSPQDAAAISQHLVQFTLGGLAAAAARAKERGS